MNKTLFSLIILFSISTYADEESYDIEKYEAFDSWAYEAFLIKKPITENSILSIGKISQIKSEPANIGHAPIGLNSNTYIFDGLVICALVEQNENKKSLVNKVEIISPEWPLTNGISVGQNLSVLSKLSIPAKKGTLKYCGIANCVEFGANNGKISSITITLYVD